MSPTSSRRDSAPSHDAQLAHFPPIGTQFLCRLHYTSTTVESIMCKGNELETRRIRRARSGIHGEPIPLVAQFP